MRIDGNTAAVVTGGASGLGKATAEALAAAGVKVAIFDINEEQGEAVAKAIGGLFCKVDITSEESVVEGFAKARAAHGQERICVHCAMTSRRGKTLAWDKEAGKLKRLSTEDYQYGVNGVLVASYRIASLSAEGMAGLEPLEDGERGSITLTASVAAPGGQVRAHRARRPGLEPQAVAQARHPPRPSEGPLGGGQVVQRGAQRKSVTARIVAHPQRLFGRDNPPSDARPAPVSTKRFRRWGQCLPVQPSRPPGPSATAVGWPVPGLQLGWAR